MTITSTPTTDPSHATQINRLNDFLDRFVLPYPVRYLTNRVTILLTLFLIVPLIAFANITVFVLAANSYLNVMSVVVSSTVLLYATINDVRDRASAQRREEIAARHQAMIEARDEADHAQIQEIHEHLKEIQSDILNHITRSLDEINQRLSAQINTMQVTQETNHALIQQSHAELTARGAAHWEEINRISKMVAAMQPPSATVANSAISAP